MKDKIQISVKGKQLKCNVCKGIDFFKIEGYLNTRIASFWVREFEKMRTTNYICSDCGYVFCFAELPQIDEGDIFVENQNPLTEFTEDGKRSLALNGECPNCFTKVEKEDVECSFCGFVLRRD